MTPMFMKILGVASNGLLPKRALSNIKVDSTILDVTAKLDSGKRIDDLFQAFTALQNRLAGNVTPITPKQIEQI
jgi:hypothetical protein